VLVDDAAHHARQQPAEIGRVVPWDLGEQPVRAGVERMRAALDEPVGVQRRLASYEVRDIA